jgi:hypothetical protein
MNDDQKKNSQGSEWYSVLAPLLKGSGEGILAAAISPKKTNYKDEAAEMRRKTLQALLDKALRRQTANYRMSQEYADESRDRDSSLMQNSARGFVDSLLSMRG